MIDLDFDSEINKKFFINNRGEQVMSPYTKEERNELTDVSMFTSLDNLRDIIHQNAVNKGFWENPMSIKRAWLLIITELVESYEAHRSNRLAKNQDIQAWHFLSSKFLNAVEEPKNLVVFEKALKDTFEDEIADVVIRVLDFCGYYKDYIGSIDDEVKRQLGLRKNINLSNLNGLADVSLTADWSNFSGEFDDYILELIHTALSIANISFGIEKDWTKGDDSWLSPIGFLLDVLAFAYEYDIDIHSHVLAKHLYNTTREYKHGKSF